MTEEEIKAKRKEILEWERDNRTSKNRAASGYSCWYYLENTPGCAIGRLIKDKVLAEHLNTRGSVDAIKNQLPPEIQALGIEFLVEIQVFHDNPENFTNVGLTHIGTEKINNLLQKWTA